MSLCLKDDVAAGMCGLVFEAGLVGNHAIDALDIKEQRRGLVTFSCLWRRMSRTQV